MSLSALVFALPEAQATSTFVVSSSHAGAVRVTVDLTRKWSVNEDAVGGIAYTGRGLVALVVTRATDRSFAATATRWAALNGEPSSGTTVTMSGLGSDWGLPPGRYVFTLVCDSACSVRFPSRPSGLPSQLALKTQAVGVRSWRQRLTTAGQPGGVVTHDLGQDIHGVALASVGASASFQLLNHQDSDVCRISQAPLCDRYEDGYEQQRVFEQRGPGPVRTAFRFTRVYSHIGSGETTLHRIFITNAEDADATVVFVPT